MLRVCGWAESQVRSPPGPNGCFGFGFGALGGFRKSAQQDALAGNLPLRGRDPAIMTFREPDRLSRNARMELLDFFAIRRCAVNDIQLLIRDEGEL